MWAFLLTCWKAFDCLKDRLDETAHTLVWCIVDDTTTIITKGRTLLLFQSFCGKVSKFTSWKKLNASYVMTDFPPRCKDKHFFSNDVHLWAVFFIVFIFLFVIRGKVTKKKRKVKEKVRPFLPFRQRSMISLLTHCSIVFCGDKWLQVIVKFFGNGLHGNV